MSYEEEFEEWEYSKYGVVGLVDCHNVAKAAYLAARQKGVGKE